MSRVAYIQADLTKNPYLTKKIEGKTIIEHTIDNLTKILELKNIYICLHRNKTNMALDFLKTKYPQINLYYSKEQNAGKRMIEVLKYIKPKVILRVTADQVFLDIDLTSNMISYFSTTDTEILYHDINDGLLPEILSYTALENCQIQIGKYHRFFKYLYENPHSLKIEKYLHPAQTPFYRFFIRTDREFYIAMQIIECKLDYHRLNIYSDLLFGDTGLYNEGWFQSFVSKQSVDCLNNPIPWMTYAAIDFLKGRLHKEMRVFEYGCGASTIWWSARVGIVTACEHNLTWVKHISKQLPENASIIHVDLSKGINYATQVEETRTKYHVIVIDSRDRINCAKSAVNALEPTGVIIWDDSQRSYDNEGKEFILKQGFKKLEFTGMGPIVKDKNETTIFYRDKNCLGI